MMNIGEQSSLSLPPSLDSLRILFCSIPLIPSFLLLASMLSVGRRDGIRVIEPSTSVVRRNVLNVGDEEA